MRCLNWDTLADVISPRYGFGGTNGIYAFTPSQDRDYDGNAETVIASQDGGGAVRFVEAPNFATDLETRYGSGTIYDVGYGPIGVTQCDNEGQLGSKVSIVIASSDSGGAIRIIEVDANTLAVKPGYFAWRYGFGIVGAMGLADLYQTDIDLVAVLSTDGGTCAAHIMDETLTDLTSFYPYYTTSDITGTWDFHFLTSGDYPQWIGWGYGTQVINASGNFTFTSITRSNGDSTLPSDATLSISSSILQCSNNSRYRLLRRHELAKRHDRCCYDR
jgi:hypothetical protein